MKRGEIVTTIPRLSSETGLTIREVRTALDHLKVTGEVGMKTTCRESTLKVHNYDVYQCQDDDERQDNDRITTG